MSKRKRKKSSRPNQSRAMPLAITDHRLQASQEKGARRDRNGDRNGEETLPAWFPVHMFFRHQTMLASAFSNLLRLQRRAAQMWLSPAQR